MNKEIQTSMSTNEGQHTPASRKDYTFEELYHLQITWAEECFGKLSLEDEDRVKSTWKMLEEELKELQDGETPVDTLDAVADLFVVMCQLHHIYRGNIEDSPGGLPSLAPISYAKNMVDVTVGRFVSKVKVTLKREDRAEVATYLLPYWARLADHVEESGMDVAGAIVEVTESNWSKLAKLGDIRERYPECATIEEALQEECNWIENECEIASNVVAVLSDTIKPGEEGDENLIRVRFLNEGGRGKLLKHSGYFKPNLDSFINK